MDQPSLALHCAPLASCWACGWTLVCAHLTDQNIGQEVKKLAQSQQLVRAEARSEHWADWGTRPLVVSPS